MVAYNIVAVKRSAPCRLGYRHSEGVCYREIPKIAARDQGRPEHLIGRMVSARAETLGTAYFIDQAFLRTLSADDQELAEWELYDDTNG